MARADSSYPNKPIVVWQPPFLRLYTKGKVGNWSEVTEGQVLHNSAFIEVQQHESQPQTESDVIIIQPLCRSAVRPLLYCSENSKRIEQEFRLPWVWKVGWRVHTHLCTFIYTYMCFTHGCCTFRFVFVLPAILLELKKQILH